MADTELTLEYFQSTLPKQYKKLISQDIVTEINHLVTDPDYGKEFQESVVTAMSILDGREKWSLRKYVDAIKFYSLTAAAMPQAKAYAMVFPERLQARLDRGETIHDMNGEASRFNSTELVNKIRAQALVPIHLVNQGTVQLAINKLTDIMLTGRSEVAKVSAATALLKELRPPETQKVELQLGLSDEARAAQDKQNQQLISIAENQRRLLEAGHSIDDIQKIHVEYIETTAEEA